MHQPCEAGGAQAPPASVSRRLLARVVALGVVALRASTSRRLLALVVALGVVALPAALGEPLPDQGSANQDPPTGPATAPPTVPGSQGASLELVRDRPPGPDDPVRRAIESGLAWLAADLSTSATGQVSLGNEDHKAPIGVTALAALAFMSGGSTPSRGPHQRPLVRTLDYLLSHVTPEGERHEGYLTAAEDQESSMHGHGLALLALTQASTLSPKTARGRRLADAVRLGVRRIELAQGPDGGWYYQPEAYDLTEGSVTVSLLQALRGARNSGFQVDTAVIARAVKYVLSLQDEQGGFMYSKQQPESSVALTAACLSTLHAIGIYDGREIDDGYLYVWRKIALREQDRERGVFGSQSRFPFYERFYLAQALWHYPDLKVFRRWAEGETRRVLTSQRRNGAWADRRYAVRGNRIEDRYGSAYATAMNVLYLSVPEGLLPIFQR